MSLAATAVVELFLLMFIILQEEKRRIDCRHWNAIRWDEFLSAACRRGIWNGTIGVLRRRKADVEGYYERRKAVV